MASLGGEQQISSNSQTAEPVVRSESREGSVERKVSKDRDEKLKLARERQNEERQRKIEELKAQAEAAQRYREQKEEERRRRIDEIRHRDTEKRHQVEERKKAIMEAEKERREYILKKNQERESRLETKKRERSSIGFAFGSSTPRLLEPADFGTISPSTFWGHRRSTSISNVAGASLSRRSSERELNDCGSKKRATSASGTERHDGSRSGNVTPGGSMNTSRPGSAMSTSTNLSTSGYVPRRSTAPMRKPRPASIAGTGVSLEEINKLKKENKPPVKSSSPLSAQTTPKRTLNMMSTSMIVTSSTSRLASAEKKTPAKRDSFTPKSSTPKSLSKTASSDRLNKVTKELKPKDLSAAMTKSSIAISSAMVEKTNTAIEPEPATPVKSKDEKNALNAVKTEEPPELVAKPTEDEVPILDNVSPSNADEKIDQGNEKDMTVVLKKDQNGSNENSVIRELTPPTQPDTSDLMSASMIAKSKITTEEEAKAALAERRRLAREEAERQAEMERQRLEAERLAEIKQQEEEAERQRQFEEEAHRLALEQRKAEEERLRQAIEEAKQREEDEKIKREEEEKQRIEREEAEKKAKEEAEKQRLEVAERLKREEKEREERRKRVEAIMSRTRKAGPTATPNSTPVKENNDQSNTAALNEQNQQQEQEQEVTITTTPNNSSNDESNTTSGSTTSETTPTVPVSKTAEVAEPQNSQAMYEQSVADKEVSLMKTFSTVNEENIKNLQQQTSQQQHQQSSQNVEIANGKMQHVDFPKNDVLLHNTKSTVANGNGHIENINNKNDINILQDVVVPAATQLIDLSIDSQDINSSVNFNNNNSLLSTTNALVTADSHENEDLSLL